MTTLFRNRSYLALWIGETVSDLGGAVGALCNSLLLYELTGSKVLMGSLYLLYFLPSLLLQLIIGPYIDRWSRKRTMVFAQTSRGLIFLLPATMLLTDHLQIWHLFLVQLVLGLIQPLYVPSSMALLPTLVPREQLTSANATLDGTIRLVSILSPPLGGLLAAGLGIEWTQLLVAACFLLSALSLTFIREPHDPHRHVRQTWMSQFTAGMRYFFSQRLLVSLAVFLAFVQFGVGATMVLNVPYIVDELHGSPQAYGWFVAGFPLGYLLGSFAVAKAGPPQNLRLTMLGALIVGGASFIGLSFADNLPAAIALEVLGGLALPFFNVHSTSLYQQHVPNHLLGQMLSVRLLVIRSTMPLGVWVGSQLSEIWGVRPLYLLIGLLIIVPSALGLFMPRQKITSHGA